METKEDTFKNIITAISKGGIAAVAILLVLFFGQQFTTTYAEIQK